MGALKLLAEFIRKHIEERKLRPKPIISNLSKTVYDEIIEIMGKQIIKQIIAQINNDDTRYYSNVMDSTPDLSHNDQLAIVLRFTVFGKKCIKDLYRSLKLVVILPYYILQDFLEKY